jgi:peptide chain release factor 2
MGAPGFWDNQETAQQVVGELKSLKAILSPMEEASSSAEDLAALVSRAGFGDVQVHTDASALKRAEDVGCMNHRLVVAARKT